jgi:predicted TIM-barrel fold metal-dependent hydrolase
MLTRMEGKAATVRQRIGHPVIDGDGHWIEPVPIFLEYLREAGGPGAPDAFRDRWRRDDEWHAATPAERLRRRLRRQIWWGVTSNTLDKATGLLPALLNERLPELGVDFALIYPTLGLSIGSIVRDDLRPAAARAYNDMTADMFASYPERFAPVAIIPSKTPQEALTELEYAVGQRGFKAVMIRGTQTRSLEAPGGPDHMRIESYVDTLALDSPYDYEPLWRRCLELRVAVTQHAGSLNWPDRASVSNYTYNHIGHFANSNHAFARGVFLGGVARRYPGLTFGFMEGGVGWACTLYADLRAHWEKRRLAGLQYPTRTDLPRLRQLIEEHGDERLKAHAEGLLNSLDAFRPEMSVEELETRQEVVDDFAVAGIVSKSDIKAIFERNFYFGCEADDPATMWAFDPRLGARLHPIFSSDFCHFDVPDFEDVLPEAFEMVDKGCLTEEDFREFTFSNAARLHGSVNPDFFKGTVIEREAAAELGTAASV